MLSGESGDVPADAVADWARRLPVVCEGYEPKDIFNADETGLFFRALPSRSMVAKGESSKGGKVSKDRITVLLAASATGEKLKPLVIGRAKKPRCFYGFEVATLGVTYDYNKKAWMTGAIFTIWLNQLNNRMRFQQRHILLFVDNCSAHPDVQLSHVKLAFLPPNTTSKLQPCDAGIIQAVKMRYRRRLLQHVLLKMDNDETGTASALAKSVNVLDAIMWLKFAWDALLESTMNKCFAKCGFDVSEPVAVDEAAVVDDAEPATLEPALQQVIGDVTLRAFADMDDDEATMKTTGDNWEAELVTQSADESDDDDEQEVVAPVINRRTASNYADTLLAFGLSTQNATVVDLLSKLQQELQSQQLVQCCQQSSIVDYFAQK